MSKLIESPHVLACGELVLYFSTEKAMLKYIEERDDQLKESNARIMKVYKDLFNIDLNILSDVRLYHKINRRGFLVQFEDKFFKSLDEMKFIVSQVINN